MKWNEEYKVGSHDLDLNRTASASAVMRFMQEAANCHMEGMTPSYDDLFDRGYAFILSRFSMSVYAPLYLHDRITASSWACESRGVSHNRCYSIRRGDQLIAEAVSVWALVNTQTGRLTRVGDVELNYGEDEMLELDMPTRFKLPAELKLSLVGERPTVYADVDMNRHMNNTHYADILCGFIPEMAGRRVISAVFSFVNEAPLGENIKIYMGRYDGSYFFQTKREDGSVNIEARIDAEEI